MRRILPVTLVLGIVVPVIVLAATNSDQQFRDCLREKTAIREDRLVDRSDTYYNDLLQVARDRRERFQQVFDIQNDRDRDNTVRSIETDAKNRTRDLDKNFKNDLKNITNDFRNDQKNCQNDLRNRDKDRRNVPVGQQCRYSEECGAQGACTTEFGDCRHFCGNNEDCQNYCQGNCVVR